MIKIDDEFNSLLCKRNSGNATYGFELINIFNKGYILQRFSKKMGHHTENIQGNWRIVDRDYAFG